MYTGCTGAALWSKRICRAVERVHRPSCHRGPSFNPELHTEPVLSPSSLPRSSTGTPAPQERARVTEERAQMQDRISCYSWQSSMPHLPSSAAASRTFSLRCKMNTWQGQDFQDFLAPHYHDIRLSTHPPPPPPCATVHCGSSFTRLHVLACRA